MSTIFAITNQKGGVGKTTTALNLASALADEDKRVLLIDNDPQGNLTASMGYTPAEQKHTLANLLLAAIDYPEDLELHLPRCILHTDSKPDLIPANRRLSDAAARLQVMQISQYSAVNGSGRCAEKMLTQVLMPLCDAYDYIIIDCGLKQELLTVNALSASDYCIIPVQSHFLASEGKETHSRRFAESLNSFHNSSAKTPMLIARISSHTVIAALSYQSGRALTETRPNADSNTDAFLRRTVPAHQTARCSALDSPPAACRYSGQIHAPAQPSPAHLLGKISLHHAPAGIRSRVAAESLPCGARRSRRTRTVSFSPCP